MPKDVHQKVLQKVHHAQLQIHQEITVQEVLESLEVLMEAGMHHLDVNHLWRALLSPLLQAHPQAQRQQNPQAEIQTVAVLMKLLRIKPVWMRPMKFKSIVFAFWELTT